MNKYRIEYFDTAKGLLMFFLVWGHMIIFAKTLGIESEFTQTIQNTVPFYRAFFMQTFFFITGFCTSWGTSFKDFIIKNIKTIILPAFIFLPFAFGTQVIIKNEFKLSLFLKIITGYLQNGIPWFLSALFIAKLCYWSIDHFAKKQWMVWCFVITLFGVGIVIKESTSLPNNWSYQHSLIMLPFLFLGNMAKKWNDTGLNLGIIKIRKGEILSNKILIYVSLVYFIMIILWYIMGLGLGYPAVDAYLDIHYITVPFHFAFAIGGSAFILIIAKLLQKIEFIKLIGRQSLFVYLIHAFVVCFFMSAFQNANLLPIGYFNGMIFYLVIYILSFLIL